MSEHNTYARFKHKEEESHPPALEAREERNSSRSQRSRRPEGRARALALPATISSLVWHDEDSRKRDRKQAEDQGGEQARGSSKLVLRHGSTPWRQAKFDVVSFVDTMILAYHDKQS